MHSVEETLLHHLEEGLRAVLKDRSVLLQVHCEAFDLMPVYGVVTYKFDEVTDGKITHDILKRGRYVFNRRINSDYLSDVYADRTHPFFTAPDSLKWPVHGWSFAGIVAELKRKLEFKK